eukprot:741261-Amphidinium_carterae.3
MHGCRVGATMQSLESWLGDSLRGPFGRHSGGVCNAEEGLVRSFCTLLTVRSVWPFMSRAARPVLLCLTRSGVSMPQFWQVHYSLIGRTCPWIVMPLISHRNGKGSSCCSTCSFPGGA